MSYLKYVASATLLLSLAGLAGASPALANTTDTPQGNATVKHLGDDTFDVAHSVMPGYSKVYLVDRSEVAKSAAVGSFQDGVKLIVDSKNPQWQQVEPLQQVVATSAKTAKFSAAKVTGKVAADTVSVNDAIYHGKQPTGDVYLTSTPVDTLITQANIKGSPIIQINSDGTIPANSYTDSATNLYCVGAACNYKAVQALSAIPLKGQTRYQTALDVAKHAYPQGFTSSYLVKGNDLASLMEATTVSGKPVLLYNSTLKDASFKEPLSQVTSFVTVGSPQHFEESQVLSMKEGGIFSNSDLFVKGVDSLTGFTLDLPHTAEGSVGFDNYSLMRDGWVNTGLLQIGSDGKATLLFCGSDGFGNCTKTDADWVRSMLAKLSIPVTVIG